MRNVLIALLLLFAVSTAAQAKKVAVIVSSSSSQTASQDDVKAFFTGTKLNWSSGDKVVLVDQSNSATGKSFYSGFLGASVAKIRQTLLKLVLSGQMTKPVAASSDAEVKQKVAGDPNAIGYIDSASVDGSVKVLFEVEV